jgi:hypothetical protein
LLVVVMRRSPGSRREPPGSRREMQRPPTRWTAEETHAKGDVRLSDNDCESARHDHDRSSVIDPLTCGQPHQPSLAPLASKTGSWEMGA